MSIQPQKTSKNPQLHTGDIDRDYVVVKTIPIYRSLLELMRRANPTGTALVHVLISRWSRENDADNAAEQASKVLDMHRATVPALEDLLQRVPEVAWRTDDGRAKHNIMTVRVRDVTRDRDVDDPSGRSVIGYLIVVSDAVIFRVSSSGFKSIEKADGDELNPYCQAVIEVLKYAVAVSGEESVCLRLSDDTTRKGRLAVELGRLDRWIERLKIRIFHGSNEYSNEGFGKLILSMQNSHSEENRSEKVKGLTVGKLEAFDKGYLPQGIVNLPPYLGHVDDPNLPGLDKRARDGLHLVTAWDVTVFPALAEYVAAFARGAGRADLVAILRRHRVPTPRQLPPSEGKPRYSSLRDGTFDQLPIEEATVRADRWMTFSNHVVRPVPSDATDRERAAIEGDNRLAIRKFEMLRTGEYSYRYSNPTPTVEKYGEHDVHRDGQLDAGAISGSIAMDWPHKRKLEERDGILVVSDELELDDEGNPVPWAHAGVSLDDIDACIARLHRKALQGPDPRRKGATDQWVRLLRISRWATQDGEQACQWEMLPRKNRSADKLWAARWLIWRPAPDQNDPLANLNHSWKADHTNARTKQTDAEWPGRHIGTVRESQLVRWAYEALRDAALSALDTNAVLSSPDFGQRTRETADRRRRLTDQIATVSERAVAARKAAIGYEDTAMIAHSDGNLKEAERKSARADDKRVEAAALEFEAVRMQGELDGIETTAQADLPVTTLARLLEVMRRSADDHEGYVPKEIAGLTHQMFDNWHVSIDRLGLRVACIAHVPLVDGSVVDLPLDGVVPNTAYSQSTKEPFARIVLQGLLDGKTFEEVAASGTRCTSRDALYVQARKLLTAAGVATYRTQALLDHPFGEAIQSVWAGITGERPQKQGWSLAFEEHMRSTYTDGAWAKAACPTTRMPDIHRVFAVIRQRPAGIPINDVAVAAGVDRAFVRRLVTPFASGKGANGHRRWPKMLAWVPGRIGDEVQALRCPHVDCPSPANRRWATLPSMLPETCPDPGEVGGVLCLACSRLPRLDHGHVPFPAAWHEPVARLTAGNRGSLRTTSLTGRIVVQPVAKVAEPKRPMLKTDELAAEFGIGRQIVVKILAHYQIAPTLVRGRGSGTNGLALYDEAEARAAINAAFGPAGEWDRAAVTNSALRISAAAKRANVTIATLKAAVDSKELEAHFTRNGHYRFQPHIVDAWATARAV